jgi:hypothetical protein
MTIKRWQDGLNGILGLWMFLSPWLLGFSAGSSAAAWSAWVLGIAIIVFAGLAMYMPRAWEEGLNILLGLCALASPWALRYADQSRPMGNSLIVGALVVAFALWAMLTDTEVQRRWHERHAAR